MLFWYILELADNPQKANHCTNSTPNLLHPYSSEFRIFIKSHYKQVVFFGIINCVIMHDIWHWGVCRQRDTSLINGIFDLNTNDPRTNIPFGKLAVARKVYHCLWSMVFLQNLSAYRQQWVLHLFVQFTEQSFLAASFRAGTRSNKKNTENKT